MKTTELFKKAARLRTAIVIAAAVLASVIEDVYSRHPADRPGTNRTPSNVVPAP